MKKNNVSSYYLPFTHVAEERLSGLARILPGLTLLRPTAGGVSAELTRLAEEGEITLKTAASGEGDARVLGLMGEYRAWGEMNPGVRGAAYGQREGRTPFYDDSSAYSIRAEISRGAEGGAAKEERDPVLSARVFLAMAQELDRENDAIGRELDRFSATEASLFSALRGEVEIPGDEGDDAAAADPADYMLAERLAAWSRLIAEEGIEGCPLFVTDCGKVARHLLEESPTAEKVGTVRLPAAGGDGVRDALAHRLLEANGGAPLAADALEGISGASEPSVSPDIPETARLTLYRIAGEAPKAFLERLHGCSADAGEGAPLGGGDTLIAVLARD